MTAPLSEQMRPKTINDIVGQEHVVRALRKHLEEYRSGTSSMPNLMFVGPPGTGKTSAALAFAKDVFGKDWKSYVLEMNASDERGIDVIREKVKDFARKTTLGQVFNVVLLDESDALTHDAQAALRRIMEDYSKHCKFILLANFPHKIIDPLKSRCAVYRFHPLPAETLLKTLQAGVPDEDPKRLEIVARRAKGDLRRAWTLLQTEGEDVDVDAKLRECLAAVMKDDVRGAEEILLRLLRGGVSPEEVFSTIFDVIDGSNLHDNVKRKILTLNGLGDCEYRVVTGANAEIQLRCFLRSMLAMKNGG